jgi:hypothetical protein
VTTTGYGPSCSCNADPAPGTVLDPFAGAGTTGLVAARNRRSFIGLELNPEYAQMARDRIATDIRLGHRPPQRVEPPQGESLFDANGALLVPEHDGTLEGRLAAGAELDQRAAILFAARREQDS